MPEPTQAERNAVRRDVLLAIEDSLEVLAETIEEMRRGLTQDEMWTLMDEIGYPDARDAYAALIDAEESTK